jgi:hypothetical protein
MAQAERAKEPLQNLALVAEKARGIKYVVV